MFALAACVNFGCAGSGSTGTGGEHCSKLAFTPELPADQQEGYICFAFDADPGAPPLHDLSWTLEPGSGIGLHHATLYTTRELRPRGTAFDCDPMPLDAMAIHVWVPGSDTFTLPSDTGIALRHDARSFIIEAHMFRRTPEAARAAYVTLCSSASAPTTLAGRFALGAPVPAIRPHSNETSSALCRFRTDLHLLFSWPHMHRAGREFHSALLRGSTRLPVLDLTSWDFNHQLTYTTEIDALAGDRIETTCSWQNDTDQYVLPGVLSTNEMCTNAVTGYPAEAAYCDPE